MRLKINGKSDSNQNFDLNSNFPSWRFVRNKVHEGGMEGRESERYYAREIQEEQSGNMHEACFITNRAAGAAKVAPAYLGN